MPRPSPFPWRAVSIVVRVVVGAGVLFIGIGVFAALVATKERPQRSDHGETAPLVLTTLAHRTMVPDVWQGYGTVRAMEAVEVAAEVSARVVERPVRVEPGMPIRRGDLLVRLDPRDYANRAQSASQMVAATKADLERLDVDEAAWREQLALADEQVAIEERELERTLAAAERGAAVESQIERRRAEIARMRREASQYRQQLEAVPARRAAMVAQLVNQEASSRIALDDLARTTVHSPVDGVLQRVDPRPGELLGVGAPVARIVDLRRVEAPLRLPVSAAASVAVGDRAELIADSPAAMRWDGRVARIAPEADARTRTITVFVEVEQRIDYGADDPLAGAGALLLPGQFVIGRVYSGRAEPRVLVPRRALDSDRVMVVVREGEGWRLRSRAVAPPRFIEAEFPALDPDETQWAVIPSGLEDGERVVLAGRDELADGMAVRVDDARAARPANGATPRAGP
ncbi:MAG: efflux RND transporter periplasmic adaptor subunit [Leptolyngbya sp. PLA2]|nr:efflux RND transporter periplasmic adaptor subunit [Leptolyngbya sp.]MCE7972125.1 efflux RND transporter periplasmic adaptor subunit [Leptolyngbya sp. PL-A2]MCQ3941508.1 hypothetical protein [cyanobacterium CYA1]MCZ7634533.1 efflux RND transporter periplasmic adaptor subunit [Phycisphaerales bacterium]MDL1905728.1 efflux RND transporter periplasmic adaptor subunit [Synechococcales cyanobacterium CNB]GIK20497.1 MAG: hypothetical protein BroJett004_26610 [Planctomycetota bacterium]